MATTTNAFKHITQLINHSQEEGSELTVLHYFLTLYEQLNHFHNSVGFRDFPQDRLQPGTHFTNLAKYASALAPIQSGLYIIYGYDTWKGKYFLKNIGYLAPNGRRKLKDRIRDHFTQKSDLIDRIGDIDKMEVYDTGDIMQALTHELDGIELEETRTNLQYSEVMRAIEYVLVTLLSPQYPDTSPLSVKARKWITQPLVLWVVGRFINQAIVPSFVFQIH